MPELQAKRKAFPGAFIFQRQETIMLLIILLGGLVLELYTKKFFNLGNVSSVFLAASFESVIAIGMTLLLIMGVFDLSVGSTFAFGGVIAGLAAVKGVPIPVAVILGLVAGAGIGLLNGLMVAKVRVNAFIATLAMMSIVRGVVFIITRGMGVSNLPDSFNVIGQHRIFDGFVQLPIIYMLILVAIFCVLYQWSIFFRQFYYIGGNEASALYSGIKVDRLKIFAFVLSGFFAALAGILTAARMGGALSTAGVGVELRVITACVIGGCSLQGGEGSMIGSLLGVILMCMVANGFNLIGVSPYWQNAIYGVILLGAVLIDSVRRAR